ncbi:unnamed protein product [Calicophoron daubneyi]|uniref:Uncharacterized protein n=1 Tax=Calicophoron daubneyi TaxID=300641 RepID=A0AAV2TNM8_CALDB
MLPLDVINRNCNQLETLMTTEFFPEPVKVCGNLCSSSTLGDLILPGRLSIHEMLTCSVPFWMRCLLFICLPVYFGVIVEDHSCNGSYVLSLLILPSRSFNQFHHSSPSPDGLFYVVRPVYRPDPICLFA